MSLIAVGFSTPAKSATAAVKLTTEPSLEKIVPYEAEATQAQKSVKLTLQAIDSTGKPLTNVQMKVRLIAPSANPLFTTDFPIVEGTQLLDFQSNSLNGQLQLEQMFPIRGNYQLQVTVTPLGGAAIQQNLVLNIPENSIKYQNFAKLALILAAVGLTGGWVIGGKRVTKSGEIAPQPVRLLLSGVTLVSIATLLYVNVSAEIVQSGMSEPMSHTMAGKEHSAMMEAPKESKPSNTISSQGIKLAIAGDTTATVGKPAKFQVKAVDEKTNQPVAGSLSVKTTNTEKDDKWVSFGYQGTTSGELAWQSGLFDGSGHQVDVEFTPVNGTPIKVSQPVEVEGVAPPLSVRLISLGYMTGITASAFLLAFYLRRRKDIRLEAV